MKAKITGACIVFLVLFLLPHALMGASKMINKDHILNTGKEWQEIYDGYEVDESLLETLKSKIGENLEIVIYLGVWCGDSKTNVPGFIKLMEALEQEEVKVTYYDVSRKANKTIKYYVKEFKVERVPTFIFYRAGKEIGRIVENPTNSLIEDFIEIIF
jgi:thiol-disulfide isomerase/thioredoxin